jgi:hypothetical protein
MMLYAGLLSGAGSLQEIMTQLKIEPEILEQVKCVEAIL